MNVYDRALGMSSSITRRDFLNGVSLAVAGSVLAPEIVRAFEQEFAPERAPDYYPPTRTGMRGSHEGSFEVAHQLRDRQTGGSVWRREHRGGRTTWLSLAAV